MCGIAGWISWTERQDLTARRSAIDAMTETLKCRGPDAGGVWSDSHAHLGHRRLAVIDLEGGQQPMSARLPGRPEVVITYSGEVYNYAELRAELRRFGHEFRTSSDTEVVLRAYLEWGEDLADHLNGIYAFALWDPAKRQLLLVRDRLGVKPLYFYPLQDGLLFGSEPKVILAHPSAQPVLDAEGLAEILAHAKTPGHGVYSGMHELRPGHVAQARPTGLTMRRYWALGDREHADDLTTTVRTVRELLEDTVSRQLVADVPVCALLSGGLDSSALTALAVRDLARARRAPLRSFAMDFADHREGFQADGLRDSPDAPYARLVAAHLGASHQEILLDTAMVTEPGNRSAVLTAHDVPWSRGEGDTSLYLLFRAIREGYTVALSGESADEIFGGYIWFHDRASVMSDTFPWLTGRAAANFGGFGQRHDLLDPGLLEKIALLGYRRARYADALKEVPRLAGVSAMERRMREISYLAVTRFMQFLLDRKDRMSMATGLEVRVPFCDHRLVEYVFNTPWRMKNFDGREKSLLRAAVADLLPPEVTQRVKSPYPSTQDPRYAYVLRTELKRLLADHDSPTNPLIAPDAAARAAAGDTAIPRASIEFVLEFDRWLRTCKPRLEF